MTTHEGKSAEATEAQDVFSAFADKAAYNDSSIFTPTTKVGYPDLIKRAWALAEFVHTKRVLPGDRIAILARNGVWHIDALLACALGGWVFLPINTRLSGPEVSYILKDANPKMVLADHSGESLLSSTTDFEAPVLNVEQDLPDIMKSPRTTVSFPTIPGDHPFLQLYTSGTTGRPKGAVLSHKNMLSVSNTGIEILGKFQPNDTVLQCLPLFHIAGIDLVMFTLLSGASLVLHEIVDPPAIAEACFEHSVTKILLVPAVARMLVEYLEASNQSLEKIGTLLFGASPMPEELIERIVQTLPNAGLIHLYGMTETTGMFTFLPAEEIANGRRLLSCGKVFPTGVIRIVNGEGDELPVGEVGEIAYQGPQIMSEYWNKPEATSNAIRDGWFYTGDAGRLDEDGFLYIEDRIKDMIKSGGENVYPAEVENALLKHPAILDCAVIGQADEKFGEKVVAVVTCPDSTAVDLETLQEFLRPMIAGFKLPRHLVVLPSLPKNSTGKTLKHELRAQLSKSS